MAKKKNNPQESPRIRKNPFDKPMMDDSTFPTEDERMMKKMMESPEMKELFDSLMQIYDNDPDSLKKGLTDWLRLKEMPISKEEWSLTHPMGIVCGGDKYYAGLASEILKRLEELPLDPTIPLGTIRTAALSGTAYLEDIVSGTHVWQAVRNLYKKRYGRILPFFEVDEDDYFEDDLNIDDLKVLVWQAFCRCGIAEGRVFSPLSEGVARISEVIYEHLVEAFDKAPRAMRVRDVIRKILREEDYYGLRTLGLWLTADQPLTAIPFLRHQMRYDAEKEYDYYREKDFHISMDQAYYFQEAGYGWTRYMSLLGCGSNELLAEIARIENKSELADKLFTIGRPYTEVYHIGEVKGKYLLLTDRAGREFKVMKNSLGQNPDLDSLKGVVCTLYRFGDVYYQNGMASFMDTMPEDKNSSDSAYALTPLPEQLEFLKEIVADHGGRRVYYCKDMKDVETIIGNKIKPVDPEADGYPFPHPDNLLLMVSDVQTPVMLPDKCQVFRNKENPFGRKRGSRKLGEEQLDFILNTCLPDDIIDYIENKCLLPDAFLYASQGYEVGKALVQDNLGFFFRFFRVEKVEYPYEEYDDWDDDDFDE